MIRDILKIIQIYVKKYFIAIIILLLGFTLFTTLTASKQLNGLKQEISSYEFEKNIGVAAREKVSELNNKEEKNQQYQKIDIEKRNYIDSYNGKISKESYDCLLHRYAVGAYLTEYPILRREPFYTPQTKLNFAYSDYHEEYKKYLTKEELEYTGKYHEFLAEQPESEKHVKLREELNKIYPPVMSYSQIKIFDFAKENLGKDKLEIKETLYTIDINIGYYILITLIGLLIFGAEYHTSFGKFVSSLPFKKERVYFAKLILSLLILLVASILVGIVNIFIVKASVLGDIYNIGNAFSAYSKTFYLGIGLILLGAIFASFCGSVVSMGALYIPVLTTYGYLVGFMELVMRALGRERWSTGSFNPRYMPIYCYFRYEEPLYIYLWLGILAVFTLIMCKVYKRHNVEREGMFFSVAKVEVLGYIILLIGVIAFGLIILFETFRMNGLLSLAICLTLVPYILWKVSRFFIRI